jgi:hypothetical protein
MVQLTTNISNPLLELIRMDRAPIDGVEVGPWLTIREVRKYRSLLPQMSFFFHGGDLVDRVGVLPGAVSHLAAYLRCTESPWLSLHITMWLPGLIRLRRRFGWRIPPPDPERATRRFIRRIARLSTALQVPILLENPDPQPFEGFDFQVDTGRIKRILDATHCGLLLDTGHALVAAARLGMDARGYLCRLPLDRIVQIHVSGPRMAGGRLEDAHETMQERDFALLDFILSRTRPRVVTLEYIRDRENLGRQLRRLREILDYRAGVPPAAGTD